MSRAIDLVEGRAYVITDLHGAWEPYVRYRDQFISLHSQGQTDYFVILGDMIHSPGPAEADASLHIVWDIMQLRNELGQSTIIPVLGNHELPHIYGVTVSKGDEAFTARFEHMLGEFRQPVVDFFESLPFCVRTGAGVMLTHAGASSLTADTEAAMSLLSFSHSGMRAEADRLIDSEDVLHLISTSLQMSIEQYDVLAEEYLAVYSREDARYMDLLRGIIVSNLEPEWGYLWSFFFTQCERESPSLQAYGRVLRRFLQAFSAHGAEQRVLVTGHIPVKQGLELVCEQQLRLASWSHAQPMSDGKYLLFDVEQPIATANDLLSCVFPIP